MMDMAVRIRGNPGRRVRPPLLLAADPDFTPEVP